MDDDESAYSDLISAPAQQSLLRKLLELSANGRRPSVNEMTRAMQGSADSNTVRLLAALKRKGYVDRYEVDSRVQARGTTLTERALKWLDLNGADTSSHSSPTFIDDQIRLIPLYGPVQAGNPVLVENRVIGRIPLPAQDIPIGKVWVQGVEGRSMMGEDGILDGDQIIVIPYPDPPRGEGEMVVATVQGDETVKRLWRDGDAWRLHPSNPDFDAITLQEDDSVIGLVVGVLRWHIKPGHRGHAL